MNLKCLYCQTPFTLSMNEKIGALRLMHTENMHHYDAYCPRCRRANSVSRERLEMFTPGWQQAINAPAPEQTESSAAPVPAPKKAEAVAKPAASRAKHPTAEKKPAAKPAKSKAPAKKATAAAKKSK